MKKKVFKNTVSLLMVVVLLFSLSAAPVVATPAADHTKSPEKVILPVHSNAYEHAGTKVHKIEKELIEGFKKHVTILDSGSLNINKDEVLDDDFNKNELKTMNEIIYYVNKKIENEDIFIGEGLDDETIQLSSNFSPTPINSLETKVFCLSYDEAFDLYYHLASNDGLSDLSEFFIASGISAIGLYTLFGKYAVGGSIVFGMITIGDRTDALEEALIDALNDMVSDEHVVIEIQVQLTWHFFSNWINGEPPCEMRYSSYLGKEIVNEREHPNNLKDYLE